MPTTLRILISSPSDVPEARRQAVLTAEALKADREIAARYRVKVLKWEDAPPLEGREPQEIVNSYTGRASRCDIVICIFGRRFGTEANVGGYLYPSGTYYEFLSAYKARRRNRTGKPVILLYRMLTNRPPEGPEEAEQAEKVEAFFKRFHGRDPVHLGLCKSYERAEDFGADLARHLRQVINVSESPRQRLGRWYHSLKDRLGWDSEPADAREKMIEKVRGIWIGEVLNDMEAPAVASFKIGIRPLKVSGGGAAGESGPREPPSYSGHDARPLFNDADHQLLILGRPGAGKTFKMLELLSDLLRRAEENHRLPIPVVFNLSSWADKGEPMADWLISQLKSVYRISNRLARRWVEGEHLALFLDGLDEITAGGVQPGSEAGGAAQDLGVYCRRRCLDELNDYISGTALWVVLSCREHEYVALKRKLLTRRANATAEVMPLTDAEVRAYLDDARDELASLREAVDADETLRGMARTPFLLNTMATAYHDDSDTNAGVILAGGAGGRAARLFDMFTKFIQVRHGAAEKAGRRPPPLPDIRRYLGVLAQKMEEGDAKLFFVDQLQPDHGWLTPRGRRVYRACVSALLVLFVWLFVGLPSGWALGYEWGSGPFRERIWSFEPWTMLWATLCCGGSVGAGFMFARTTGFGAACGLAFGLSRMIVIGMAPDKNGWFNGGPLWSALWNNDSWLVQALITTAFAAPALALVMWAREHDRDRIRPFGRQKWDVRWLLLGVLAAAVVGLAFWEVFDRTRGTAFGVAFMIILGLAFGYLGVDVDIKTYPNQGVWQSGWNALGFALSGAAIGMLCFGLIYRTFNDVKGVVNCILGLAMGSISLVFGALPLFQHLSLRHVLARRKLAPFRLVHFLEAVTFLQLIRRAGGGYMFLHEYLRDYFRDLHAANAERPPGPRDAG